jgi:hypothetical protein
MPSWLSSFLKQPLVESIRVFNNPVKILQWILPLNSRTQRVLFSSLCPSTQYLNALLAEYLPTERLEFMSPPVHLCTRSMPTWQSSQNPQ